jgi:hypothetical protein
VDKGFILLKNDTINGVDYKVIVRTKTRYFIFSSAFTAIETKEKSKRLLITGIKDANFGIGML